MAQAAEVIPQPPDVYYVALEEYLLHNALHILIGRQGHGTVPPAAGLALINDLIQLALDLLDEPEQLEFLWYAEALCKHQRRCQDTHILTGIHSRACPKLNKLHTRFLQMPPLLYGVQSGRLWLKLNGFRAGSPS